MAVAQLHLELVGGPFDGAELVVPDLCECCGKDLAPGSSFVSKAGERYVVTGNRCYAVHQSLLAREGDAA